MGYVEVNCAYCGEKLLRYPSQLRKGRGNAYCNAAHQRFHQLQQTPPLESNCVCATCGKDLRRDPSTLAKMNGVAYCDKKCQGIAKAKMWSEQRAKTNTECITCGKPLRKRESDLKDKNYCSNACRGKAMERNEPNAVCALCGKEFHRSPAHIARVANTYCSLACSTEANSLLAGKSMNGLESDFAAVFPELRYVGDGQIWFNAGKVRINPDFIILEKKLVVELWGDYWHRNDDPVVRVQQFAKVGWKCMVIWESEFRNTPEAVISLVRQFLGSG